MVLGGVRGWLSKGISPGKHSEWLPTSARYGHNPLTRKELGPLLDCRGMALASKGVSKALGARAPADMANDLGATPDEIEA